MNLDHAIETYGNLGIMSLLAFLVIYLLVVPKLKSTKKQEEINLKVYENAMLHTQETQHRKDNKFNIKNCPNLTFLKQHIFFQDVLYMMREGVKNIDFGGPVRNQLFSDMCIIKLDEFYVRLNKLCESAIVDMDDWYATLYQLQQDAVTAYEYKWVKSGVPEIARKKFQEWHEPRVQYVSQQIDKIRDSGVFSDICAKTKAVLDLYTHILGATLIDIYGSAYDLNGSLTGILYKGQLIEPLKHFKHE